MKLAFDGRLADLDPEKRTSLLERRPDDEPGTRDRVREIVLRVRREGDSALLALAAELDGVTLESVEVPRERWERALGELDPAVRDALERARDNVHRFHEAQVPQALEVEVEPGVRLGRVTVPLPAVGVYAPGGRASYPSSVLMGVVPARAVGVQDVILCSPPGPEGAPPDEVLAAAALAGATRVFALGGPGAIAAMAYGTETVPAVSAIVGPGNRWVTEAKRQVAGDVLTDAPAGPSEVLVVADSSPRPDLVAGELVAQAEHDPEAAAVLVSPSRDLLDRARVALEAQVAASPRRQVVEQALARQGALLLTDTLDEALDFADAYAAEHLALYTAEPRHDVRRLSTAGSIFLGPATSVAFGDYITGANHVLPTAGLARSFSGLSAADFLRSFTTQEVSAKAASRLARSVATLAEAEGLPGHARAALAREEPS